MFIRVKKEHFLENMEHCFLNRFVVICKLNIHNKLHVDIVIEGVQARNKSKYRLKHCIK